METYPIKKENTLKLNIIHRNCEPTQAIDEAIRDKASKIKEHFPDQIEVSWTCQVEPEYQESKVMVHHHKQYFYAHAQDNCFYKTIDQAYKKIERQIREFNHKHKKLETRHAVAR